MSQFFQQYTSMMGFTSMPPEFQFLFFVMTIWTLAWKGVALWKAAKNNDKYWYIALLVINTVGILEIIYIFIFADKKGKSK